jgi:hypothetical protein
MKKLLLSVAALGCFASAYAQQWNGPATSDGDISRNGNINIGTLVPNPSTIAKLFVQGSSATTNAVRLENGVFSMSSASAFHVDAPHVVGGRFTITTDGNVGIGTYSAPQYRLDVVGRARFQANSSGTAGFWLNNFANTAIRSFVGMVDDNAVGLWGEGFGNWGFSMNVNTGNVTVGSPVAGATGDYKFNVWGRARANEVVVNTNGADFVFAKDYRLRPLGEVEQFINTNQHLPEIPSAKEMQQNGMAVGELQTKLLQKVEELTLYVIEQNKKLEAQNQKIESLEQALAQPKK